jgi:hypothetical protein
MIVPSGRTPLRIALTICAWVQRPIPVSGSGVMFGATTCPRSASSNSVPPAISMPAIGWLSAFRGVWQRPQAATDLVK